jgi:hypothetical protein
VGDPLIYRVKGCVGETPFPQQTPPKRHPFYTIDHMFYFSTLPLDQFVIFILQFKNSSKNSLGKNKEKYYNNMPSKTPLKTRWENIMRNHMTYVRTCICIVSLKTLYEKP